jgi:dienelactone hydrolase
MMRACRPLLVAVVLAYGAPAQAKGARSDGEIISVVVSDGTPLKVRVLMPRGRPPFRLAIVNHGSPPNPADRPSMPVPLLRPVSDWLLSKGYIVALPLRRGYGESGGRWAESYGACREPDYYAAGMASAQDITDVLQRLRARSDVRADRILLVGRSAGGWGSLAAIGMNPPGVFAVINLAGGRGGAQPGVGNCTPARLVEAAARFGAAARVPSLWLYSANDRFFEPKLAREMHQAFVRAGGRAQFVELPAFGADGHQLFVRPQGRAIWQPHADAFLARLSTDR